MLSPIPSNITMAWGLGVSEIVAKNISIFRIMI